MMIPREACPQCGSRWFKRNGHIHTGKQNHRCKVCGRAFVLTPENALITAEQRTLIERSLVERISLRGICRAVGVGLQWLWQFMVERFQAVPEHLCIDSPGRTPKVIVQRLEAELDELWSFVGKKANRHWVWIAMDATTHQVIAFHVGDRSGQSAIALWEKIPAVYQEHALFYTDHYAAYTRVIPSAQHRVGRNKRIKSLTALQKAKFLATVRDSRPRTFSSMCAPNLGTAKLSNMLG
jgi:insertion element IS1 protein InsB